MSSAISLGLRERVRNSPPTWRFWTICIPMLSTLMCSRTSGSTPRWWKSGMLGTRKIFLLVLEAYLVTIEPHSLVILYGKSVCKKTINQTAFRYLICSLSTQLSSPSKKMIVKRFESTTSLPILHLIFKFFVFNHQTNVITDVWSYNLLIYNKKKIITCNIKISHNYVYTDSLVPLGSYNNFSSQPIYLWKLTINISEVRNCSSKSYT